MKKIVGRKSCGNVHVDLADTADLIRELNYRGYYVGRWIQVDSGAPIDRRVVAKRGDGTNDYQLVKLDVRYLGNLEYAYTHYTEIPKFYLPDGNLYLGEDD